MLTARFSFSRCRQQEGRWATVRVYKDEQFAFTVERLAPPAESAERQESTRIAWWAPPPLEGDAPRFPPAWVSPSNAPADEISLVLSAQRPIDIGGRLPLTGSPDMRLLGEALHGFLAADRTTRSAEQRFAMARDALDRWGVTGAVQEASMLEASDRFNRFVTERWPRARWRREVPIFGCIDKQRVSGRIDLLIDSDEGCVIFDHKTFPGAPDTWAEKALSFASQIALYLTHNCRRGRATYPGELHPHVGSRDVDTNCTELKRLTRWRRERFGHWFARLLVQLSFR